MIRLKILIVLSVSILFTANLNADEYNNIHLYKNLDYLQLDKTQEEKIKQILVSYKKDFAEYYKKKHKTQKKLQKIISDSRFDEEKYEHAAEDLFEEMIELEIKVFRDIHNILNPLQREQFSNHLQEWLLE
ncbi:MAG: Spy/CpxP family protein refolding chaperone [Campylobacterota bacterium]|jgi:Spy/CpxP family protein refolding chaperone